MKAPERFELRYLRANGKQWLTVVDTVDGLPPDGMAMLQARFRLERGGAPWIVVCEMVCKALNALEGVERTMDGQAREAVGKPGFLGKCGLAGVVTQGEEARDDH